MVGKIVFLISILLMSWGSDSLDCVKIDIKIEQAFTEFGVIAFWEMCFVDGWLWKKSVMVRYQTVI